MNYSRQQRQRAAPRGACVVVFILALAIGGHWAVLQATAWTTMLARYSRHASLAEAFSKTFDGQHPCSLCKVVQKGKAQEKQQRNTTIAAGDDLKLNLPPQPAAVPEMIGASRRILALSQFTNRDDPPLRQPPRS